LPVAALPDVVHPAYLWVPDHAATSGPECADLAASAGMLLDAEQRLALDALLAETSTGAWATFEAALIAARQNLKTFVLQAIALHRLFLLQDRLTVWTAHEFPTALEAFRDITVAIDGAAHLSRKVKTICNTNGEEAVELHSGARLIFRARSKRAGRGLSGNTVILDEAFALMPHHLGSLLPTLSAVPNSQVLYGSSAGHLNSATLRAIRDRGRKGGDPSLTYVEWCAPTGGCSTKDCDHRLDTEGCALDDETKWRMANPALGRRITYLAIRGERRALSNSPLEFARERLGWWEDPPNEVGGALDDILWGTLADPSAERGTSPVFAVATAPDRSWAAIAVAWKRPDGRTQVMLADYRPTTTWIAERLLELREHWGGTVIVDIASRGLIDGAEEPTQAEQALAHNALSDAVLADMVRHGNEQALNVSVRAARWRPLGDTRVLDRKGSTDISPLIAAALAVHGADQFADPAVFFFTDLDDDDDEELDDDDR
jgi:hypothetical protein